MTNNLNVVLIAALAVAGASLAARAQDAGGLSAGSAAPTEKLLEVRFGYLDLDGNGHLTRDEVGADDEVLRSQFGSLDADGDGRLSPAEFTGAARRR